MPRTAGIVVIGNEILSGKVTDTNSPFLTRELRALGVELRRITTIPDELDMIGDTVREFSGAFDVVFTSGGVGPTHDDVTIEVADTGMGIPADDLPRLFQRFTRATNAIRGAISGTGVGLAIVRQLIEMHGGAVSVESTEGAGATFRVRIPRRERAST